MNVHPDETANTADPENSPENNPRPARNETIMKASDFARTLGWQATTPYRKVHRSRKRLEKGLELSKWDMPIPDASDKEKGEPRWKKSTFEKFIREYPGTTHPAPPLAATDETTFPGQAALRKLMAEPPELHEEYQRDRLREQQ